MSSRFRNDFLNEESFGVEINPCSEVAATTVAMDSGFTYNQVGAAGTLVAGDTFEGMWLASHTAAPAEIALLSSTNSIFNFVIGQPIRFIADITFQLLAAELNLFVGCGNAMATAMTVTAGGGMKVTGQHFGFYTPDNSSVVYGNPASIFAVSMHNDIAQITELTAANSIDRVAHEVAVGSRHQFQADWVPTSGIGGTTAVIFEAAVEFRIDGVTVAVHEQGRGVNFITPLNTDLMQFGIYTENITSVCTHEIRQLKCRQLRALSQFGG